MYIPYVCMYVGWMVVEQGKVRKRLGVAFKFCLSASLVSTCQHFLFFRTDTS